MRRKFTVAMILGAFLLMLVAILPAQAEEQFTPTYAFHGSIDINVDSYSGYYLNDPKIGDPPPGLDQQQLEDWMRMKKEDDDIRKKFTLSNPTIPGESQTVHLDFYANPFPDLELQIKTDHHGMWGGQSTSNSLSFPLVMEEAYATYYTDKAMYTIGRYKYDLGVFNLLVGGLANGQEGLMVNTMYKDVWMTGVYNILLMSTYKDYPYVSDFLFDDLAAFRFSTSYKNNLVGINLLPNGCYDERGLSLDFNGKIKGVPVKAEVSAIYPAWVYRKVVPAHMWPAALVTVTPVRNQTHSLDIQLGAMDYGYISQYGIRGNRFGDGPTKFCPNTIGFDILYQRGLTKDTVIALDYYLSTYWNKDFQAKEKREFPMEVAELKVTKYLSSVSNASLGVQYFEHHPGQCGFAKATFNWHFDF